VTFNQVVEETGRAVDIAGVMAIAGGIGLAVLVAAGRLLRRQPRVYQRFRQEVGRAILLGLELLVAADIIRTVAISPTLASVAILSGIVLVRTFLSFSLEVELTGTWPWQRTSDIAEFATYSGPTKQPPESTPTSPDSG
jgi:uncharacterized membrane protein